MSRFAKWPRLAKAIAIVGALVVAAPASGLLDDAFSGNTDANSVDAGLDATEVVVGFDPLVSLDRLEVLANAEPSALPRYFDEEIGLLPGALDVRVNSDGSIVGYVVDNAAENAHQLVSQHMEAAGWSEVNLGAVQGSTYLKDSGLCRWALATFTQVGSVTSVVYRCVVA